MLSATGKKHQNFAPERAIWNTDLEKAILAQHVRGSSPVAKHIALKSAGAIIGLLGKVNVGKYVKPGSKSAKMLFTKSLEMLASLAASRIKGFLRLTISTLKRKLGHLTCNTRHSVGSFCGKWKSTAVICKFFVPTVIESKRTNSHGLDANYFDIACERIQRAYDQPDMFVAPPEPKPGQEDLL